MSKPVLNFRKFLPKLKINFYCEKWVSNSAVLLETLIQYDALNKKLVKFCIDDRDFRPAHLSFIQNVKRCGV